MKDTIRTDIILLSVVIVLSVFGIFTLFSASYHYAAAHFGNPMFFFHRQSIWLLLAVFIAGLVSRVSVINMRKYIPALFFISLVLLCIPLIPGFSSRIHSAQRWIIIGSMSFQPSELVKITLVLYLAHILAKKEEGVQDLLNTIIPLVLVILLVILIVYLQNDFSTAGFLFLVSLLLLFIGGVPLRYFLLLTFVMVPVGIIFLFTRQHRVERLLAYFRPEYDPQGVGYQVVVSRSALSEGGLWGTGIGQGSNKFGILPEVHSDFILTILGEELGYFGIILVIILFVLLAFSGYSLAYTSQDNFVILCSFGLTSMIFLQFLLNMSVVIGLLPTTGINLPFFSAGGSSLLVSFSIVAIIYQLLHRQHMNTAVAL